MGEVTLGLFHEPPRSRPMVYINRATSIPWFSVTGIEFRDKSQLGGGRLISAPTLRVHHGEEVKAGGA